MALLVDLITNLQTALTTGTSPLFSTSTAFYSFDPESTLKAPPADQYAVIQPTGLVVKDRSWAGSGKVNYVYTWTCTLWLFTRLATDEAHRDDLFLLDPTFGNIATADAVISLLQDFTAENAFGYELDAIEFPSQDRPTTGWAATRLHYHTDLAGRAG